jgi:hypothetical protein
MSLPILCLDQFRVSPAGGGRCAQPNTSVRNVIEKEFALANSQFAGGNQGVLFVDEEH